MEPQAGEVFAALFSVLGMSCLCLAPPAVILLIVLILNRETNKRLRAVEAQLAALNARISPAASPQAPPPSAPAPDLPAAATPAPDAPSPWLDEGR